jgi:hypothetical protein
MGIEQFISTIYSVYMGVGVLDAVWFHISV